MALVITIDNNEIPTGDIKTYPVMKNVAEYNNNLIAAEMDIVLDNTDGGYSDTNTASQFYGVNWVDKEVTVYDDELDLYVWVGRIKNLTQDDRSRTVTVRTANYIRDLVDVSCVYTGSAVSPAEAIYDILTDVVGVPDSYIQFGGFQDAINIQEANSATINITFTSDDNKTCMGVIQELMRMSQCVLYTMDNIIHLWQWRQWDGVIGKRIGAEYYLPGSLKTSYEFHIYNAYAIYYNNAGTAALATGTQSGTLGDKKFVVPDENMESTTSTDYRILYTSSTGANWAGVLAMSRYQYQRKIIEFELDEPMKEVDPNDQVDITFGDYRGEPIRLIGASYDANKHNVKCEGEFLNLPVNVVTRDTTPPSAPVLVELLPLYRAVFAKFSIVLDADLLGYRIYLSPGSPGQWRGLLTNLGESPVEVATPSLTPDGYNYLIISELTAGAIYHAKASAYDTSFNESDFSDALSCSPIYSVDDLYCLQGSIYGGLTLDIDNSLVGTVPEGYTTYDDLDDSEYDWELFITASYQSGILFAVTGFDRMQWKSTSSNVYIKVAESDDGVVWTWGSEIDTLANNYADLMGKQYIKYVIIFYSPSWDDTDSIYITHIEEAA